MKRQLKNIIALVIERRLEIMCNKYSERRERQLLSALGGVNVLIVNVYGLNTGNLW